MSFVNLWVTRLRISISDKLTFVILSVIANLKRICAGHPFIQPLLNEIAMWKGNKRTSEERCRKYGANARAHSRETREALMARARENKGKIKKKLLRCVRHFGPTFRHTLCPSVWRVCFYFFFSVFPLSSRPWTTHLATRSLFGSQWTVSIYTLHVRSSAHMYMYRCTILMDVCVHESARDCHRDRDRLVCARLYTLPSVGRRFN